MQAPHGWCISACLWSINRKQGLPSTDVRQHNGLEETAAFDQRCNRIRSSRLKSNSTVNVSTFGIAFLIFLAPTSTLSPTLSSDSKTSITRRYGSRFMCGMASSARWAGNSTKSARWTKCLPSSASGHVTGGNSGVLRKSKTVLSSPTYFTRQPSILRSARTSCS